MWTKPYGILAMNPDKYREIDGVVFDLASYERHCRPPENQAPAVVDEKVAESNDAQQQNGVFAVEPFPTGWYPAEDNRPPVPIMGGAIPPANPAISPANPNESLTFEGNTVTVTKTVFIPSGSGSGSGSYMTSYTTSYKTSFVTSGSGSGSSHYRGMYVFGSYTYFVGGYGLELV